jgi:hypothetical protein
MTVSGDLQGSFTVARRLRCARSARLRRRPDEDLVECHPAGPADGEGDHLGDVLRADRQVLDELLGGLLGRRVRDVVGQLGTDGTGLDDGDADVGLQLLTQRLRPAVDPPLGRGVDAVGRPRGAPGDRRDVDQVAAAVRPGWSRKTSLVVIAPRRLTSIIWR